jgi:hypothetical protein
MKVFCFAQNLCPAGYLFFAEKYAKIKLYLLEKVRRKQ